MKKVFLLCAAALLSAGLSAQATIVSQMPVAPAAASSISVNVQLPGHVKYEGGSVLVDVTCASGWRVDVYGVYFYSDGRPSTETLSPQWARVQGAVGPYYGNGTQTVRVYIDQEIITEPIRHIRHARLVFTNIATGETATGYIYQGA